MLRNHWGILINAPSADATANLIRANIVHANGRAGVAILGTASGNTVDGNDATGNGLLSLAPSLRFDLFGAVPGNNTWRNNQGTANFAQGGAAAQVAADMSAITAEAFGTGGCMHASARR